MLRKITCRNYRALFTNSTLELFCGIHVKPGASHPGMLWAFQKLINNLSFNIRQFFSPFLEFLGCLSHPICYFANDLQWRLAAI